MKFECGTLPLSIETMKEFADLQFFGKQMFFFFFCKTGVDWFNNLEIRALNRTVVKIMERPVHASPLAAAIWDSSYSLEDASLTFLVTFKLGIANNHNC